MAETSSLLNCRTGYRTGGSNPPASAYFCNWRFRLVARTHASHAWNTGSIPVGATKKPSGQKNGARTHTSHTLFFYEHEFDSRRRYKASRYGCKKHMPLWRFRLVARTHASHAWNTGSIPVGATKANTVKMVTRTHASHTLFMLRTRVRFP